MDEFFSMIGLLFLVLFIWFFWINKERSEKIAKAINRWLDSIARNKEYSKIDELEKRIELLEKKFDDIKKD